MSSVTGDGRPVTTLPCFRRKSATPVAALRPSLPPFLLSLFLSPLVLPCSSLEEACVEGGSSPAPSDSSASGRVWACAAPPRARLRVCVSLSACGRGAIRCGFSPSLAPGKASALGGAARPFPRASWRRSVRSFLPPLRVNVSVGGDAQVGASAYLLLSAFLARGAIVLPPLPLPFAVQDTRPSLGLPRPGRSAATLPLPLPVGGASATRPSGPASDVRSSYFSRSFHHTSCVEEDRGRRIP